MGQHSYQKIMPLRRVSVTLTLEIDLDSVHGYGYNTEDHIGLIRDYINGILPHYNPVLVTTSHPRNIPRGSR